MDPIALDGRMLLQLAAVLASLSGAWAVVRAQVRALTKLQQELKDDVTDIYTSLDRVRSSEAVKTSQIKVLGDILSPNNLEKRSRELGAILKQIDMLESKVQDIERMHNGKHPHLNGNKIDG